MGDESTAGEGRLRLRIGSPTPIYLGAIPWGLGVLPETWVTARTTENEGRTEAGGSNAFVRRTEREFWYDPDRTNRWVPAFGADGAPLIEDHHGSEEECSACGTQIRWLCFVTHPTRGVKAVGRCCIHKVIRALPEGKQELYREAVGAITRAMQNAIRRSQGKPEIVSRRDRLRNHIMALEAASRDSRLYRLTWQVCGFRLPRMLWAQARRVAVDLQRHLHLPVGSLRRQVSAPSGA